MASYSRVVDQHGLHSTGRLGCSPGDAHIHRRRIDSRCGHSVHPGLGRRMDASCWGDDTVPILVTLITNITCVVITTCSGWSLCWVDKSICNWAPWSMSCLLYLDAYLRGTIAAQEPAYSALSANHEVPAVDHVPNRNSDHGAFWGHRNGPPSQSER